MSFRCRRFLCCHEIAIEFKVLLANEKLMFLSYLVEGMDRIAHCAQEGKVEDAFSTGTIEEDDDKLEQAVTNIAPTSLKRLVGRQAVIKTGHKPECRGRSIKIALLH